ncbi:MAG TPA: ferritin [Ruminiclostridium sp.]|nr:ferritin [Ruminiclostridium sp.]
MISENMNNLLNRQVQKEFYSAYLYLSFQAYFQHQNLDGFANFFYVQVQEERDHAMKFFNYIAQAGGEVQLFQIDEPFGSFSNAEEIFEHTLKHEQDVTKSIYNLVDNALQEKDHGTNSFLQWFVTEQIEEEANVDKVLRKLQLIKNDPHALLMLDAELATRVYTPPPAV